MSINEAQFIEKKQTKDSPSDFEFLVAQAMDLVQRLTGHTWTDYNLHDPGVTILEQVCFAMTDLAYKTNFPVEDILTDINGIINRTQHCFFSKEKILTCNPVTINDFRKVILDEMKELNNVMLVPTTSEHSSDYIKGLYKILIRVNSKVAQKILQQPELKIQLKEKVAHCYLEKRNLGEDMIDVTVLEPQRIDMHADIIIQYNIAPEEILVNIYNKLESILNPKINFYTEEELLGSGMKIEEIYCGPLLKNGFLPDSELKPIETEIDPIELTNAIMQVEGVVFVQNIGINDDDECSKGKPFLLNKNHFPLLDITSFFKNVNLYTDEYELQLKENTFFDLINRTAQLRSQKRKAVISPSDSIKRGMYRNPGKYYSLQNNFPITYGIGTEGLSPHESDQRKAAAHQLKAYLLFFEQILANYLAQLENIGQLYSTNTNKNNRHSYYYQPLYDVPGIQDLLKPYTSVKKNENKSHWKEFITNPENGYLNTLNTSMETLEEYMDRKNKIFDHLLARFNRKLAGLPVLQYFNLYVQGSNKERAAFILQWKASILDNLTKIDQKKNKAFNYLAQTNDISGFEKMAAIYLHVNQNDRRQRFSSIFDDGKIALVSEDNNLGPLNQDIPLKTKWDDEDINIVGGSDEIIGLSEIGKLIAGGIHQNQAYILRNQKIDILKYGLNIENYKIGPAPNNEEGFVIIIKSSVTKKWEVISRHPDKLAATKALNRLITYFRKLSMESEGFHVLEHLLLRPELNQPSFGFRFYSGKGEIIFQNDQWTSFEERENILSQIKQAVQTGNWPTDQPKEIKNSSAGSFQIKKTKETNEWEVISTDNLINTELREELQMIRAELEKLNVDKTRMFPRFELLVQLPDGTVQTENLYNLQVTIIMPAWPARFQDTDFRLFAENLFCSIAPAYLHFHFRWLGVSQMKKFENLYFQWLDVLREKTPGKDRNKLSAAIVSWLNNHNPQKQM
ncbi:MAG: hypothetical protein Q8928_10700 [Bacteroidota bacterium]|nr:hypothetical protein [Bacteroidota bacterium]